MIPNRLLIIFLTLASTMMVNNSSILPIPNEVWWCGVGNEGRFFFKSHYVFSSNQTELDNHIYKITQSPVDLNIIIFHSVGSKNWISEDCGITLRLLEDYSHYKFHPTDRKMILRFPFDYECIHCSFRTPEFAFYISNNLAQNWTLLVRNVEFLNWYNII
jgi:hypothetical protein